MPSAPDPHELGALAVDIARRAAALLRERPADLDAMAKTTPTDTVTVMDRASERLIVEALTAARPGDRIVAEESGDIEPAGGTGSTDGSGQQVRWVVDPLDGTVNYLYGLPHFAVSIAAEVDGTVVAGAVHDVGRDETYAAVLGYGAYRLPTGDPPGRGAPTDGTRLRCSEQTDPAYALTATGFGYASDLRAEQAQVLLAVLPGIRDIRRAGCAALDLCAVAAGRVDAFFEAGMHPWDWAAGALIAREAGARVDGVAGRPPGNWTTLAANPALFAALDRMLTAAGTP